ncbi:MAG: DUF3362 domain-containing protein, partial [Comamonas sp.]
YQSARKKNSTQSGSGGGIGYTVNKEGKAVAVRRRTQESNEPQGDVRFRTAQPKPGQMLSQHTGLPPRAGVKGGKPAGKPAFKAAAKPGSAPRKPR